MPTFELSGPDGATYHLDAPDEGAALSAFQSFGATNSAGPNSSTVVPPKPGVPVVNVGPNNAAQPQPSLSDAVTDIPAEIGRVASANLDAIKQGFMPDGGKGSQGNLEGFLSTGRALAAIPGLLASPITGAARSLLGHPLAQAEHAAGTVINPQVAAQDNPQEMYSSAADSAQTALMGLRAAGLGVVKPATAISRAEYGLVPKEAPPVPAPSTSKILAAGDADYEALKQAGNSIAVPPDMLQEVSSSIKDAMNKKGYRPSVASQTHTALDEIATMGGDFPDLTDLIIGKRTLKEIAGGANRTERKAAMFALPQIDAKIAEIAPDLLPVLKRADANWAAGRQAEAVEKAADNALNSAQTSGTGGNLDNATRQQFRAMLKSAKQMRGLSQDEVAAVREIAQGTVGRNALRLVGKLDPTAGGLNAMLQLGATLPTGGMNIPTAIAGMIARRLAERSTTKAVTSLSEMIRARSPLAQSAQPGTVPGALPGRAASAIVAGARSPMALFPSNAPATARRP